MYKNRKDLVRKFLMRRKLRKNQRTFKNGRDHIQKITNMILYPVENQINKEIHHTVCVVHHLGNVYQPCWFITTIAEHVHHVDEEEWTPTHHKQTNHHRDGQRNTKFTCSGHIGVGSLHHIDSRVHNETI